MRSRTLSLFILLVIGINFVSATPVSRQQAEKCAQNYLHYLQVRYSCVKPVGDISFTSPYIDLRDGVPVFYAFNFDKGYIIISGDDAYTPVIGYSFEGNFSLEGAPDNFRGFIGSFADRIAYMRENGIVADEAVRSAWNELLSGEILLKGKNRDIRNVEPLLAVHWDQGYPYNVLCPEDEAGPGGYVWVGCVATAMAQIMYYWRYPEVGNGSYCYWPGNWEYGEQCADFGNTYYDWEGMINGIDQDNVHPNAELQYHCAVSVDMDFSPNGSGSWSSLVPERLAAYWGYEDAEILWKDDYGQQEWMDILREEIDAAHPLYYSGYSEDAGHAFVCDGYQGDYFHFNFGWGGSGNGYFSLNDVGGFHYGQACIRHYVPSDPAYPYFSSGSHTMNEISGSFTDGSGPADNYQDSQYAEWLIDAQSLGDSIESIKLNFSQFDLVPGDSVLVYNGSTRTDPLLGAFTGNTLPQPVLSDGDKMLVVFQANENGTGKGFYAEYYVNPVVFCSGNNTFTEPYGTISDGSGSYNYHDNSYCTWFIKPEDPGIITMTFNYLNTQPVYDKIAIFDGNSPLGEFWGQETPGQVVATSGQVFIAWITDGSVNGEGWSLNYEVEPAGMSENLTGSSLETYPNPATDELNVVFRPGSEGNLNLRLCTITGEVIYNQLLPANTSGFHSVIDTKQLGSGLYFLEIDSDAGRFARKVIINH